MRHLLICFALLGLAFAPAEAVNGRLSIRLHIDAAEAAIPVLSASTMRPRAPRGSSALFVSSQSCRCKTAKRTWGALGRACAHHGEQGRGMKNWRGGSSPRIDLPVQSDGLGSSP